MKILDNVKRNQVKIDFNKIVYRTFLKTRK